MRLGVLIILGILGLLQGVLPLLRIDNNCVVTALSYCQGEVPVYINMFEKLILSYMPLLFSSIVILMVGVTETIGLVTLPPDIKLFLLVGYALSTLPLTITFSQIIDSEFTYTVPLEKSYIVFDAHFQHDIGGYLIQINQLPTLFILSLIAIAYFAAVTYKHRNTL